MTQARDLSSMHALYVWLAPVSIFLARVVQQDIHVNIIAHSHNQTSFFFQKELRQFLFIRYGYATTKKVSHKNDETESRWAKCAP